VDAPFTVVLGPYQPDLEETLVSEICRYKASDPLAPLLVLVPSDDLCHRLKVLLALEKGLNLLNLSILTFYALSRRLFEEQAGRCDPALRDDLFFEEALRHLLRAQKRPPFAGLDRTEGGAAALWQTLRDLRDGCVDPADGSALRSAAAASAEGPWDASTRTLFRVYQRWCTQNARWDFQGYSDLDRAVLDDLPSSPFLKTFRRVFYYGFCDLTQAQMDIFQSVARHFPTTLLFPLMEGRPEYLFAQRFYERYVQGLVSDPTYVRKGATPARSPARTIVSCAGAEEEVAVVAGEIVRLVEEEGLDFEEIGVVARTLAPYGDLCHIRFAEQGIPMAGAHSTPLLHFPRARVALLLMQLPLHDYPRAEMMELFASPYFRHLCETPDLPLWETLTQGIIKGWDDWRRLERIHAQDAAASQQLAYLRQTVEALHAAFDAVPARATWSEYVAGFSALWSQFLACDTAVLDVNPVEVALAETLAKLSELDRVVGNVTLSDFVEAAQRALSHAVIVRPGAERGVAVMDAMSARGLPFRALFMLGLNERTFPRAIREDPFLKDRVRREIETTLGCKVGEKQAGYDEEKLLFTLLSEAARERLYYFYQRCDASGRTRIRSWYLDGLCNVPEQVAACFPKPDIQPVFHPSDTMLPREWALSHCLNGQALSPILPILARVSSTILSETQAGDRLANPLANRSAQTSGMTAYDGITGPLPEYWESLRQNGISPTALESYGRCPFQFFATQVLGLPATAPPQEIPGPQAAGWLCHAILKMFHQARMDPRSGRRTIAPDGLLQRVSRKVFDDYAEKYPVGPALVWELFQEGLVAMLWEVIQQDVAPHSVALEMDCAATLDTTWPPHLVGLPICGRIDRIDRIEPTEAEGARFRVIDYKFKAGKAPSTNDRNPTLAAIRGLRLQLPLYRWMSQHYLQSVATAGTPPMGLPDAAFYFLAPRWLSGPLVVTPLRPDEEARIRQTVSLLLTGIQEGRFFILPGDYCDTCAVRNVCRKDHPSSRLCAAQDPLSAPHQNLRREKTQRS
jgi:ATP-dependent helicase/nuclease subunit B